MHIDIRENREEEENIKPKRGIRIKQHILGNFCCLFVEREEKIHSKTNQIIIIYIYIINFAICILHSFRLSHRREVNAVFKKKVECLLNYYLYLAIGG